MQTQIDDYLQYCVTQKNLSGKTCEAYQTDLIQFQTYMKETWVLTDVSSVTKTILTDYMSVLNQKYKPRSAKRKLASLKAFFSYLEYEEILTLNPFRKIRVRYREPEILPRTISAENMEGILEKAYQTGEKKSITVKQKKAKCRDAAVIELLISTGLRVSELCGLKKENVDLQQGVIRILGKGAKERLIPLANQEVVMALKKYEQSYWKEIKMGEYFFYNSCGRPLSEQSVRRMIRKYAEQAHVEEHITPHMFRHTFATMLLEEDVDIRYIQQMLGHSSILTTQIYTHVAMQKQKRILEERSPRKRLKVSLGETKEGSGKM